MGSLNKIVSGCLAVATFMGCEKSADSFSLLAETNTFKQSEAYAPRKIDILWVIDNSGSMDSSQVNVANNLNTFISRFIEKRYDFHIGVTTTDAYLSNFGYGSYRSYLRDGVGANHTGVFVLNRDTPNFIPTFTTNILQGTGGSGDERAFSSMKATLLNNFNAAFRRPDAFLAVILVSDEEDFSHNNMTFIEDPNHASMESVASYKTWLDTYTSSTATLRNYSFNTIQILDSTCLATLNASYPGRKIAQRTAQLADMTGGIKASLCGNFADSLQLISDSILELSSVFQLNREPIPETIVVTVNGVTVPQDNTNGWVYDAVNNTITFKGTSIPAQGSDIRIAFDPRTIRL